MKITLGDKKRYHVYDIRPGGVAAIRQMWKGQQIWPDTSDVIKRVVLDNNALLGQRDFAYWQNVLYLYRKLGHSDAFNLTTVIDGREYALDKAYHDEGHVAKFNPSAGSGNAESYLDFGADGPGYGAIRAGDEIEVDAVVPYHDTGFIYLANGAKYAWGNDPGKTFESGFPGIPELSFRYMYNKGEKKVCSGMFIKIWSQPSNALIFDQSYWWEGHHRGDAYMSYATAYRAGEKGLKVWLRRRQADLTQGGWIWSAFNKRIKVKVKQVLTYGQI